MKTALIGPGRWGKGVLSLLKRFSEVRVVGLEGEQDFEGLKFSNLDKNVSFTTNIHDALEFADDFTVITISGQIFRNFLQNNITSFRKYRGVVVLQMKALELGSGKRLTEIWDEVIDTNRRVVVVGPVHSEYLIENKPVSMVISSEKENQGIVRMMLYKYKYPSLKLRPQYDLVGVEIGASLKNPVGIMAGILFALGYESLVGELITRAIYEIGRVVSLKGGRAKTVTGLSHLGDYAATVFCSLSRNRRYGEFLANKFKAKNNDEWTSGLVEGIDTVRAFWNLVSDNEYLENTTIDNSMFPLFRALHAVLFEGYDIYQAIQELRNRPLKEEFVG